MRRIGSRSILSIGLVVALAGVVATVLIGGASAASQCAAAAVPNALTTTSPNGTKVYGSQCSDRIVVTSPRVREVVGGEGNDIIFANPDVEVVDGGEGDDTIYGELPETETGAAAPEAPVYEPAARVARWARSSGALATASIEEKKCEAGVSCYGGIGSQKLIGSGGNDKIFGQRGNDELFGNAGNDELFGGIGDEPTISGGAGNDLLSGGLGTDRVNGNEDSDLVRGDGTIDTIEDTGPSGVDTLSFATAVTPGFSGEISVAGFPANNESEERGVSIDLSGTTTACGEFEACDNSARYGGGNDNIVAGGFENVIGSPFADKIVGSSAANKIYGGGGADLIYGGEGNDEIYGGADGDYIKGEGGTDVANGEGGTNQCATDVETTSGCSGSEESVKQRDRSKISVGFMATTLPAEVRWMSLYLVGSNTADHVKAAYTTEGENKVVTFTTEGESAPFDTSSDAASAGCTYETAKVKCTFTKSLDAITVGGMAGNDVLTVEGVPETATSIILGGEGNDELIGNKTTEDTIVDGNGNGNDVEKAYAYDDALMNNEGADVLEGGNGNDLLVSSGTCQGDTIQGAESSEADGAAQNSASFAQVPTGEPGVVADLESEGSWKGTAGNTYSGGPACTAGALSKLRNIDDLEATNGNDIIFGDEHENNLLGRPGKDEIWGRGGNDNIEAKDEIAEVGGGGAGTDSCTLDGADKFNSCNP